MQKYQLFLSCSLMISGFCYSVLAGSVDGLSPNSLSGLMQHIDDIKTEHTNKLEIALKNLKQHMLELAQTGQAYDFDGLIKNQKVDYTQDWEALKQAEADFHSSFTRFNEGREPTEKMKTLQQEIDAITSQIEDLVLGDVNIAPTNAAEHQLTVQNELLSKRDAATRQAEIMKTQIQNHEIQLSNITKSLRAAVGLKKGLEIQEKRAESQRAAEYAQRIQDNDVQIEKLDTEKAKLDQVINVLKKNVQYAENAIVQYNKKLQTHTPRDVALAEQRNARKLLEGTLKKLRHELRQEREAHSGSRETRARLNAAHNALNTQIDIFVNKHVATDNLADCHARCSEILLENAETIAQGSGRCTVESGAVIAEMAALEPEI